MKVRAYKTQKLGYHIGIEISSMDLRDIIVQKAQGYNTTTTIDTLITQLRQEYERLEEKKIETSNAIVAGIDGDSA